MIEMVVGVTLAVCGYFLIAKFVPVRSRRGLVVAIISAVQFLAWSQVVPIDIRNAVIVASVLALALVALAPRTRPARRTLPVLLLTTVYFGMGIISTYLGYPDGVGLLLRLMLLCLMLTVVVAQFTASDLRLCLDGILASAFLQAVFGLIEFGIGQPVLWGYKTYENGRALYNENPLLGDTVVRIQGTASHWIPYAVLIAAGFLALVIGWRRYALMVRIGGLVLFPICLVLSGARSAMLGLAAAFVVILVTSPSSQAWFRNTLLGLGLLVTLIIAAPDIADGIDALVSTGSFINRLGNVAAAPALLERPFLQSFFGSGADSEASLFAQGFLLNNGFNVIDNQLVTTLATQGLLGLILLSVLFITGFVRAGRIGRAGILMMAIMLFSFDYFKFTSMLSLLFFFLPLAHRDEDDQVSDPGHPFGLEGQPTLHR